MEKTIKIDGKEVRLNNNIGWAITYKDQFGQDIIQTLLPAFVGMIDVFAGLINETGKTKDVTIEDIAKLADGGMLTEAVLHFGSLEFTDFIGITWALAKTADDSIPDPKTWVRQFDNFPVDEIAPEVIGMVINGVISTKNSARLKSLTKKLQPLT